MGHTMPLCPFLEKESVTLVTPELQKLLDENPELKIKFIKPTASQIVSALIDGLNHSDLFIALALQEDKHHEMVLNHAFHGLSIDTFNEVLEHLIYLDYTRLKRNSYAQLLARVPTDSIYYGRIKGSMMFELCRHIPYDEALVVLKSRIK